MEKNPQYLRLLEALTHLKRKKNITQAKLAELMGTSQTAISRNLNTAKTREVNDEILVAMNQAVDNIFNLDYIVNGRGTLTKSDERTPQTVHFPVEPGTPSIIDLYAQLIKEVEGLRHTLNTELHEVVALKEQLKQEHESLQTLASSLSAMMGTQPRCSIAYPTAQPQNLMVAENSEMPNVAP